MSLWNELWNDPLYRLVLVLSVGQVMLLCGLMLLIAAIRTQRRRHATVTQQIVQSVSDSLFRMLAGTITVKEMADETSMYSTSQRTQVLEKYVATLAGQSIDQVNRYFDRSGMLAEARKRSRSRLWWRRLEAARILGTGGSRLGARILLGLMDDKNLSVRLAAARSLGRSQDPQYIEPLLRLLGRGKISRAQIAEVLVTLGPDSRQRLRELVMQLPPTKRTSTLRATTVEVLALVGDAGATPFIQYSISSGDTEVRIAAYKAAGILRARLSHDEVRKGLRDPAWQVRAHAATVVGRAQMLDLAEEMGRQLGDPNWWVRLNAARALRDLGNPGLRILESVAEHHEDPFGRGMAMRILTEDPSYSALTELREQLVASAADAARLETGDTLVVPEDA